METPLILTVTPALNREGMSCHIYGHKDFDWRQCKTGYALHAMGHRNAIVHVVPDQRWPGMWRIRHPDGRLSDMANLTWAKDGAKGLAMRLLDPRRRAEQERLDSPPMRQNDEAATPLAPAS